MYNEITLEINNKTMNDLQKTNEVLIEAIRNLNNLIAQKRVKLAIPVKAYIYKDYVDNIEDQYLHDWCLEEKMRMLIDMSDENASIEDFMKEYRDIHADPETKIDFLIGEEIEDCGYREMESVTQNYNQLIA